MVADLDTSGNVVVCTCRLDVPMQQGGGLVLSGGMAWSPKQQQLLAFCGDVRDARPDKSHYSAFEPRSHLWLMHAPA